MITAVKAELRKLLTVRSTYVIVAIALALVVFFAGYVFGFRLKGADLLNPKLLADGITGAISFVAIFGAFVSILLVTHEYRYNTILYSLTSQRSRTVLLLAKIVAITLFSLVFTTLVCVAAPLFSWLGVQLAGNDLVAQTIPFSDIVWRVLFYGWGSCMLALLIATLVRNQIGAIITYLIAPATIESLLSLVLKENAAYLPFSALNAVLMPISTLSFTQAAWVLISYLAAGWLVAWALFLRRDAN
jgi:ABC-2 type transport system permease protein